MRIKTKYLNFEIDLDKMAQDIDMDKAQLARFARLFEEAAPGVAGMVIELFVNLAVYGTRTKVIKRWRKKHRISLGTGPPPAVDPLIIQQMHNVALKAAQKAFKDYSPKPLQAAFMHACEAVGILDDNKTADMLRITSKAKTPVGVAKHVAAQHFRISTRVVEKHLANPHAGSEIILSAPFSGLFDMPNNLKQSDKQRYVIMGAERGKTKNE
ncbi:hypothetical protein MYX84_00930 [Acidobacteria bacterium AH-259-O06]|nr:hypothetical protein [Acidobacteria bacterium AH-259-O06]